MFTHALVSLIASVASLHTNAPIDQVLPGHETMLAAPGAIDGPGRLTTNVRANATDVYDVVFRGKQRVTIIVSGDGDTDLDLLVYDENGNLVASDTDFTDQCLVSFTPRWTGKFRIEVQNLGDVYNCYTIAHD